MISLIKNFIKCVFRPIFNPFLLRIRLIIREEIMSARTTPIQSSAVLDEQNAESAVIDEQNTEDATLLDSDMIDPENIAIVAKEYLFERCRKRKLLIYGVGSESQKISKELLKHDIHVVYYLDDEATNITFENKAVRSYIDVAYEPSNSFFVIVANEKEHYSVSRQKFMQLGLIEHIDFTYYLNLPLHEEDLHYDVTLSFNRIRDKIEGFELFGDINNPDALKIVALGGSATESVLLCIKGWAQYLAELFIKNGISVIVYCGGITGYTSAQELLKLIRDVLPLKPDIVLSYSGFNDLWRNNRPRRQERERRPFITDYQVSYMDSVLEHYPEESRIVYYGLENKKTASELWLDNTRIMHAIAKEFNILFLSFLQPSLYVGNYKITDSQRIIFKRKWPDDDRPNPGFSKEEIDLIINDTYKLANDTRCVDYITDLTCIFSDYKNIYLDIAHVNEEGNEIIAQHIYEKLVLYLDGGRIKQ